MILAHYSVKAPIVEAKEKREKRRRKERDSS
jgi:hypothetical protein